MGLFSAPRTEPELGLTIALLDPTPVGADEADRLARDYDQSLRRSLGMIDAASK